MPPEFGRDVDRLCVLELARELDAGEAEPPDAAGELADAVSALRLATAGAIAAGPVVFERLDFRPLRISPLLPIAATQPLGEAIRLDALRGRLAADLRERLPLADDDRELAEALDRWELSLFADGAVPLGPASRCADRAARRRRRRLGGGAARGRAARREDAGARRAARGAARPSTLGRPRATRSAARSSRRCCTATAPSSSARSTRRCSGCGRGRRACSPRRRVATLSAFDAQSRHRHVTPPGYGR